MFLTLAQMGITLVDAVPVLVAARAVKTPLELDIHRVNARLVDESIDAFLPTMVPGRTENEMWAALTKETFARGALHAEARLLCSGPRTNLWMQEATNRVVRGGDLVAFTDLVGPVRVSHRHLTHLPLRGRAGNSGTTRGVRRCLRVRPEQHS